MRLPSPMLRFAVMSGGTFVIIGAFFAGWAVVAIFDGNGAAASDRAGGVLGAVVGMWFARRIDARRVASLSAGGP